MEMESARAENPSPVPGKCANQLKSLKNSHVIKTEFQPGLKKASLDMRFRRHF